MQALVPNGSSNLLPLPKGGTTLHQLSLHGILYTVTGQGGRDQQQVRGWSEMAEGHLLTLM